MPITNTTSTLIQAETLELLEWPRLCQHLATFAATKLGVAAALDLEIPATQAQTAELLAQTQETYQLESRAGGALSFEGIQDIGHFPATSRTARFAQRRRIAGNCYYPRRSKAIAPDN